MCRTNRITPREWLAEVQRDPVTLGETRRRIECLLLEPVVARAVARRLARLHDAALSTRAAPAVTTSQARHEVPERAATPASAASETGAGSSARGVLRDFILASDGAIPGRPFGS